LLVCSVWITAVDRIDGNAGIRTRDERDIDAVKEEAKGVVYTAVGVLIVLFRGEDIAEEQVAAVRNKVEFQDCGIVRIHTGDCGQISVTG
jgi:hypothetical protein